MMHGQTQINFIIYACPSGSHWTDFHEIGIWIFPENLWGTLHVDLCTIMIVSL
jgi:hypothetical protein